MLTNTQRLDHQIRSSIHKIMNSFPKHFNVHLWTQIRTSVRDATGTARARALASTLAVATGVTASTCRALNWPLTAIRATISTNAATTTEAAPTSVSTRWAPPSALALTATCWPTTGKLVKVSSLFQISI